MTMAAIVSILALAAQTAAPAAPFCGSPDRDIGRGFHLTQYMFGGLPDFTLHYRPAATSIVTQGVTETATFQLMFRDMNFQPWTADMTDRPKPSIGYRNYEFRKPDGGRIWTRALRLDCGGGQQLEMTYSNPTAPVLTGPMASYNPFFGQRVAQCVEAIRDHGRIKLVMTEHDLDTPAVVIEDDIPLRWAVAEAERLWRAETARAEQGLCRMMPPLPPIPVLTPPPPPRPAGG